MQRHGGAGDSSTGGNGGHGIELDICSGGVAGLVADVEPVQIVILNAGAFQNVVIHDVGSSGVGGHLRGNHNRITPTLALCPRLKPGAGEMCG